MDSPLLQRSNCHSHSHHHSSDCKDDSHTSNSAPDINSHENLPHLISSSTCTQLRKSHSAKTGARHSARALSSCVNELNGWNPFQNPPSAVTVLETGSNVQVVALSLDASESKLGLPFSSSSFSQDKISSTVPCFKPMNEGSNQQKNLDFVCSLSLTTETHTHSTDCVSTHIETLKKENAEIEVRGSNISKLARSNSTGAVKGKNLTKFDSLLEKNKKFPSSKACAVHSNACKCFIPCKTRKAGNYPRSFTCPAPKVPVTTNYYNNINTKLLEALPECQPTSMNTFSMTHRHSSMSNQMEISDDLNNDIAMNKVPAIGSSRGWRNRRKQISQALLRGLWRWREGLQGRKKKRRHGNEDGSSGGGSGKSSEILGCVYISDPTSEQCPFSASASQSKWSDLPPTSSSGELYYSSGGGGVSSSKKLELKKKRQEMSTGVSIGDVHLASDFAEDFLSSRWAPNEIQASNSDYGSELGYGGDEELGYDDFQVDDNEEDMESEGNVKSSNLTVDMAAKKKRMKAEMREMRELRGKGIKHHHHHYHHSNKYHGNYFSEKNEHGRGRENVNDVDLNEKGMDMESEIKLEVEFQIEGNRMIDSSNSSNQGKVRKSHRMRRRRKHSAERIIHENKEILNKDDMMMEKGAAIDSECLHMNVEIIEKDEST